MRRTIPVILSAAAVAGGIAGCGDANPGTASGNALVRCYSTTRYKVPYVLAQDFVLWVSGHANVRVLCKEHPPRHRLSASERTAAAAVVIHWAKHEAANGGFASSSLRNGRGLVAYLRAHGVRRWMCSSAQAFGAYWLIFGLISREPRRTPYARQSGSAQEQ